MLTRIVKYSVHCFSVHRMAFVAAPRTFARQVVFRTFVRNLSERAKELRTKALLDKIIRVDHAGETGAKRIYQGQLAVLGNTPTGPLIQVKAGFEINSSK